MAHTARERYSEIVLAKMRRDAVLKDGVVFNNDYEGTPTAGAVKIPVRDTEVAVSDYDKAKGIAPQAGSTTYVTMPLTKDKAVNEIIDGFDAASVPANLVADRLDSAAYSLQMQEDDDGSPVLLADATRKNVGPVTADNIYSILVDVRKDMTKKNIPNDGKRYFLATPDTYALILKCPEFIKASDLGDEVVQSGIAGKIAGLNIIEWNNDTEGLIGIAGHPRFATRVRAWKEPIKLQDLSGSGNYIGASAVQGREIYDHMVTRSIAIIALYSVDPENADG